MEVIRDNFEPYLAQFAEDTQKIFGVSWTAEPNWAETLPYGGASFALSPGAWMKNIFEAAIRQLKHYTRDGTDDMVVEAIQDASPQKTIAVGIDDEIKGFCSHRFKDGKLWLMFKSGSNFSSNVDNTLDKMLDSL